ncbi:uncharacterized protein [Amphiura filiformis]|uniref:uncharacterized protein n=1 Tax=Amphiura filiformis TaxID=82378 RepID=UPI003B210F88
MASNNNRSPIAFRRYQKTISDKLMAKDIKMLRFLCKDILTVQSLEKVKRGLNLFTELEKMMLLTMEDVSLIVELMELIKRKDMARYAKESWDAAAIGTNNQQKISDYRRLLLTVALDVTTEDMDGIKHMASGYLCGNIEEIKDAFELITVMEKECVITKTKVDVLCEILPNQLIIEKVLAYKRDVLGQPVTPANPTAAVHPMPGSFSQHPEYNTTVSAPNQANPNSMGASGTVPLLPTQYSPHPYQVNPLPIGVSNYPHGYPCMTELPYHTGHQQWGVYPLSPQSTSANYMGYPPHVRIPEHFAMPPNTQQTILQPSYTYVPTQNQVRLVANANAPNPQQQTPPRNGREPVENTSPPDPQQYSNNIPPMQDPRTNFPQRDKAQPSATVRPLTQQQNEDNRPPNTMQQSMTESDSQGDLHGIQPQSAVFYSCPQGSIPRTSHGDSKGQDVVGLERNFASLTVDPPEVSASSSYRQNSDTGQPGTTDAANIPGTTAQQNPATNMGASSSSSDLLTDTFPADLSMKINSICGNNTDNSQQGNTQAAAGVVGHVLDLDAPYGLPSLANISPSDLKITDRAAIPCYQLTHEPRGLAIIINNETFVKKPPHNFEFRAGAYRDSCNLFLLFRSLKFDVRCLNNLSMQKMHDILDEFRRYDHGQYDAFICCILTHGQMGEVYGSDSLPIRIEELLGLFNGVKCRSLIGKPKLFFIQACQGNVKQPGRRPVESDNDNPPDNAQTIIDTIPIANDYLVGYSTLPGYASYRNTATGSWYVISLVKHIQDLHESVDMANVLALVNGHMSRCSDEDGFKQSSPYRSTLTQPLFL